MGQSVQTPICRVAWAAVFGEGDEQAKNKPCYTVTLMLPKNKEALATLGANPDKQAKMLKAAKDFKEMVENDALQVAEAKFKKKAKGTRWNPIIDGDEKVEQGGWEGFKNFWFFRAKTKYAPKIKTPDGQSYIPDGDDDPRNGFYSGCWARAFVSMYAYEFQGNKGVACGLGAIQKAYNDDVFESETAEFDGDIEELDESDRDKHFDSEDDDDLDDLE